MRFLQILSAVLLLSSCNDIDGRLKVFKNFALVDEDGHTRQIKAKTYSADFSYDRDKKEVELEIDDFYRGKDIDFEFHVPHMSEIDFGSEEIEIEVLAADSGQDVDLSAWIERERGEFGPYRRRFGDYCHDPYAYYSYPQVVYDIVEKRVDVDIEIRSSGSNDDDTNEADDGDDTDDDLLAVFAASACQKDTYERYCIDCYGYIDYSCFYRRTYYCD